MSIWVHEEVTCPRCEERFAGRTVNGLNVTRNPDIRQVVLAGTLNLFECPRCGATVPLQRSFLYTDLNRRHFLAVHPHGHIDTWSQAEHDTLKLFDQHIVNEPTGLLFRDTHDLFRVRVVFGMECLREKLLLWDAGLDDRLFELMKLYVLQAHPALMDSGHLRFVLDTLDVPGDQFSCLLVKPDGSDPLRLAGPLDAYRDLLAREVELPALHPHLFRGAFVDLRRLGDDTPPPPRAGSAAPPL